MKPAFDQIEARFKEKKVSCLHSLITLSGCNTDLIKSDSHIKELTSKLNDMIFEQETETLFEYEIVQEAHSAYNVIKKGCIAGIYCNFDYAKKLAYIDIYSSKLYNPYLPAWFTSKWFEAENCTINIINRS
jgi:hypothetical protein